ncbi:MAG: bacteriohemerythrin [Verrucomicrobiae bacterium]|nr:bacteriohemerythrin [Verrucomicrobiae bacterium]
MVQWTEQFATGLAHLDEQHQILIHNINHLEELLLVTAPVRDDRQAVMRIVSFLEFYGRTHFMIEEECMHTFRCPAQAQNQQAHTQFMTFIKDFQEQFHARGFQRELAVKLHDTMVHWIEEHILRVDTRLRPCVKR